MTSRRASLAAGLALGNELVIGSFDTGVERAYRHAGISLVPPRWLRDGNAVVLYIMPVGDGGRPGRLFYRVSLETGSSTRLFPKDTEGGFRSNALVLSPDSRTAYLPSRAQAGAPWIRIVQADLMVRQAGTRSSIESGRG